MKHAVAPWTADQEVRNSITIYDSRHREIASVYSDDIEEVTKEQWAVARLIVAAPEMAIVLCRLLAQPNGDGDSRTLRNDARALLAKIKYVA